MPPPGQHPLTSRVFDNQWSDEDDVNDSDADGNNSVQAIDDVRPRTREEFRLQKLRETELKIKQLIIEHQRKHLLEMKRLQKLIAKHETAKKNMLAAAAKARQVKAEAAAKAKAEAEARAQAEAQMAKGVKEVNDSTLKNMSAKRGKSMKGARLDGATPGGAFPTDRRTNHRMQKLEAREPTPKKISSFVFSNGEVNRGDHA